MLNFRSYLSSPAGIPGLPGKCSVPGTILSPGNRYAIEGMFVQGEAKIGLQLFAWKIIQ